MRGINMTTNYGIYKVNNVVWLGPNIFWKRPQTIERITK